MKKLLNKPMSLVVALALVCSLLTQPLCVWAADGDTTSSAKVAELEQAALDEMNRNIAENSGLTRGWTHVSYYPAYGVTSGHFVGASSSTATFTNVPAGTMYFSYSFSGGEASSCYLRFYYGTTTSGIPDRTVALNANDYTGSGSIFLTTPGTYTVEVYYNNGLPDKTIYFAYNLYRMVYVNN